MPSKAFRTGAPQFSPEGRRLAYAALRSGKWFVVVDGAEGRPYDDIHNLQFTADGSHYVYTARRGAKYFVVADGAEGRAYDGFLNDSRLRKVHKLNLDARGTLSVLAVRGGEFLRVELEIVEE